MPKYIAGSRPYECVTSNSRVDAWVATLDIAPEFAIDTETTGLDPLTCKIVGISLAVVQAGEYRACYIPLLHKDGNNANRDYVVRKLRPLLEDANKRKILHNAIFDVSMFRADMGIALRGAECTYLLDFVLTNKKRRSHSMDTIAKEELDHDTIQFGDLINPLLDVPSFDYVRTDHATLYAAEDTDVTLRIWHKHTAPGAHPAHMLDLYADIEQPLIEPMSYIRTTGVCVDVNRLQVLGKSFELELASIEAEFAQLYGNVNMASPKQMSELLYDTLKLEDIDGERSTDADTLATLPDDCPAVRLTLRHRSLSKLISSYTDKLPSLVHPVTGRVHTDFNIANTPTARFTSSNPNLQNIPGRTDEGKQIRSAFVAPDGYKLISADYSQIELRVLAQITGEAALLDAFHNGHDIHEATAARIHDIRLDQVTKAQRRDAKTINFGIIYGMGANLLGAKLGLSYDDARRFIDTYLEKLPSVATYRDETDAFVRKTWKIEHQAAVVRASETNKGISPSQLLAPAYVETLFGRRCYTSPFHERHKSSLSRALRQGGNYRIQGSAADIIRRAIPRVDAALVANNIDGGIILQVHDELLVEARSDQADKAARVVKYAMEHAMDGLINWRVPIIAEAAFATNWADAH